MTSSPRIWVASNSWLQSTGLCYGGNTGVFTSCNWSPK